MNRDPRKEAIKAQRIAADSAARVRSYLGALAVYRPDCVPAELIEFWTKCLARQEMGAAGTHEWLTNRRNSGGVPRIILRMDQE